MKGFNSYQQLHFTAIYGHDNSNKKSKKYSLMEGGKAVIENVDYALCVIKRKQKIRMGCNAAFLHIQLFINIKKAYV